MSIGITEIGLYLLRCYIANWTPKKLTRNLAVPLCDNGINRLYTNGDQHIPASELRICEYVTWLTFVNRPHWHDKHCERHWTPNVTSEDDNLIVWERQEFIACGRNKLNYVVIWAVKNVIKFKWCCFYLKSMSKQTRSESMLKMSQIKAIITPSSHTNQLGIMGKNDNLIVILFILLENDIYNINKS